MSHLSASTLGAVPSVSLVIPAYNEQATIERALYSAMVQTVAAHEIIVVDNLSTDATASIVTRVQRAYPAAPIRLVCETDRQGITPTRDRGFNSATGEVFGRIDADSVIWPDWIERVSAAMRNPDTAAVSGPVTYYDLPFRPASRFSDDLARRILRMIGREHPFLVGCNMAIRADAWRTVREHTCADDGDRFHEDLDLAIHLREAGLTVGYAPEVHADVSARRLWGSRTSFRDYTARFDRTYAAHGIPLGWEVLAPRTLLHTVYGYARALRLVAPARSLTSAVA
jgi:cellulose synthase/poly-beta-1,6-N-acetylglucosamine synthase-like glycosyltransferase